jgi:hypothetical protein
LALKLPVSAEGRVALRLDPKLLSVFLDERRYFFDWRSSSAPKKANAALSI